MDCFFPIELVTASRHEIRARQLAGLWATPSNRKAYLAAVKCQSENMGKQSPRPASELIPLTTVSLAKLQKFDAAMTRKLGDGSFYVLKWYKMLQRRSAPEVTAAEEDSNLRSVSTSSSSPSLEQPSPQPESAN